MKARCGRSVDSSLSSKKGKKKSDASGQETVHSSYFRCYQIAALYSHTIPN
jgi:hypothetical protein